MEKTDFSGKFIPPFSMCVAGPTMSGKSTFVEQLLTNYHDVIENNESFPQSITYCYSVYDKKFDELKRKLQNIEFKKGISELLDDGEVFDDDTPRIIVLDDLSEEISTSPHASKLFTTAMHHNKLCVIFILQNLYQQGKAMRNITLNCSYLVLFRNSRDIQQIKRLQSQTNLKHLVNAYERVTSEQYQPLIIDLKPYTKNVFRLRSHYFDDFLRIYEA